MKKTLLLVLWAVIMAHSFTVLGQTCPAPTFSSVTIVNESCPLGGQLTVTGMTPVPSALPGGDYYEYQLTDAAATVVRSWQASTVFSQLPPATYRVQMRRFCYSGASYSTVYAPATNRVVNAAITAMGTPQVIRQETCPGNAIVKSGALTPAAGTLPAGEHYEYRLIRANDSAVIKVWQVSDTFMGGITAGVYKIQARRICTSGISSIYTQSGTLTITSSIVAANITSISVSRTAKCCDGTILVNATGSGPLEYAIVSSLNAPDIPASLLKPKQRSNTIDSLCGGTHYVRVWDICGGYATTAVTVGAYTLSPTLGTTTWNRYACDSLQFAYPLNNIRLRGNHPDTAIIRNWIVWPDGSTDTIALPRNANATTTTQTVAISYSKLDPSFNPALPFPANISGWPKSITIGYRDNCGTVYTLPQTLHPGALTPGIYAQSTTTCDSAMYRFLVYHNSTNQSHFGRTGSNPAYSSRVFMNAGVTYSLDNGTTWNPLVTSAGFANTVNVWLARNATYQVKIAYCGDTLSAVVSVPGIPVLNSVLRLQPGSNNDCYATVDVSSAGNVYGDSVVVEILSANPPLLPMPAPVKVAKTTGTVVFTNLPVGTYTFRTTDSIGTECPRYKDETITISQSALGISLANYNHYACKGRSGIMLRYGAYQGTDGRPLTIEVLDQPAGAGIPSVFSYTTANAGTSTTNKFVPQLYNLPVGDYRLRLTDSTGTAAGCPRTVTHTLTIGRVHLLDNDSFALKQLCNGALVIDQYDSLVSVGSYASFGSYLVVEIYDALGVRKWTGAGGAGDFVGNTRFTVPQATVNSWPNGNYRIRAFLNYDGAPSINDSCTVTERIWEKKPVTIDASGSKFYKGCGDDTTQAVIVGLATGSQALPYSWVLYKGEVPHQDSIIAGPQASNIFNGLSANKTYLIAASDACGFGQNYVMRVSNTLRMFATNASHTQCPGEDVRFFTDNISGAVYQWYKNDVAIAGATGYELQLVNIQRPDSGRYHVKVGLPSPVCDIISNYFNLRVDCTPLPVQLGEFTAYAANGAVQLDWTVYTEHHNKGFYIERSHDSRAWQTLEFVKTKALNGNGSVKQRYEYADKSPVAGSNFYRLKQVDLDGQYEYSPVRLVRIKNGGNPAVHVFPNPVTALVNVEGVAAGDRIVISGADGRVLQTINSPAAQCSIDMSAYLPGLYFVSVADAQGEETHFKIIKE